MGCDIHLYSESLNDNDEWIADAADTCEDVEHEPVGSVYSEMAELPRQFSQRDYWFFGLLAGVRRDVPGAFEPKGFPEEASEEIATLFTQWDCDAHTPSYLTKAELQHKAAELLISTTSEVAQHNASKLAKLCSHLTAEDPQRQRIVFWFDN